MCIFMHIHETVLHETVQSMHDYQVVKEDGLRLPCLQWALRHCSSSSSGLLPGTGALQRLLCKFSLTLHAIHSIMSAGSMQQIK